MADYQVYARLVDKKAIVQIKGDVAPDGTGGAYTKIGEFSHDPTGGVSNDITVAEQAGVSHVFYHHVRNLLYKRSWKNLSNTAKFPENITDMQEWSITIDTDYVKLTNITVTPAGPVALSLAGTKTQQLAVAFTPANATNQGLTYASSDATKATVSNTGLITGIAVGTANITVTSADGDIVKTVVVNVAA